MSNLLKVSEYERALEQIANYDLTQERSGVNVAVLQGIARDALYGPEEFTSLNISEVSDD